MPKFMNAELIAIRDSLSCGHCGCVFKGSDSQAWKVKYEKKTVYCSTTCRHAALRNKFSTPIPNRGPCPTCNQTFFSRLEKIYCSMDCYIRSPKFQEARRAAWVASLAPEVREKIAESNRTGGLLQCLECGEEFYQKASGSRKFCGRSCYRTYFSKRFDRWVANPESFALPQCYDEFLDREELSCIVDGCSWRGTHLTLHVNQAHGIRSEEFKRAAGFNLNTGVIAKPLAKMLQQRSLQGVALASDEERMAILSTAREAKYSRYISKEAQEHRMKAYALCRNDVGPMRVCAGCGEQFQQRFRMGRALYCTVACRDKAYRNKDMAV